MRIVLAALGLALVAACQPAPPPPLPAPTPEPAPVSGATKAQMIDCAGAIAALAGLDPAATEPTGADTPLSLGYWTIQALLDKEEGTLEEKRAAIAAAKAKAGAKSSGDLQKEVAACQVALQLAP